MDSSVEQRRLTTAQRVALSIGGGVALLLAGAGAANADGTTGNATANGNSSDSSIKQPLAAKGKVVSLKQGAGIDNDGDAVATTGSNTSQANGSVTNGKAATKLGTVATGAAEATGNQGSNSIEQPATVSGATSVATVVQSATIDNDGNAAARTGGNVGVFTTGDAAATGNVTDNGIAQATDLTGSAGVVAVTQGLDIFNDANAEADTGRNTGAGATGAAMADGNVVGNAGEQLLTTAGDAAAAVVATQRGNIANTGLAYANTGNNAGKPLSTGNATTNGNIAVNSLGQSATVAFGSLPVLLADQEIDIVNDGIGDSDTGNNSGANSGASTGAAEAWGNDVTNDAGQDADVDTSGPVQPVGQDLNFDNDGKAWANTGVAPRPVRP